MSIDSARLLACARELVVAGQELYQRGWSPATSSNYSMRLDANSCAVTVSGKHKGRLTEADIMAVDLQGEPLMAGKPSAETLLHCQLYRWSSGIGAALHTHSPAATVLSMLLEERDHIELAGYELIKAFHGQQTHETTLRIPVFHNTQDIPRLADEVQAYLELHGDCHAYIIRGHGVYTWGRSMDECHRHLEALEFLLSCELEKLRIKGMPA